MTSVPNWIPRAVIFAPRSRSFATMTPIVEYRATKTQVIVRTSPTGPERRFYLDSLTEVGQPKYFADTRTRLEAPDSPAVLAAKQAATVVRGANGVITAIEKQRLQDSSTTAEELMVKLEAIRQAVVTAQAALAEVL